MNVIESSSMLGNGVYSFLEAARYTGLKQARIREWFRTRDDGETLFASYYGDSTEQKLISFRDLVEAFIAGKMRESGIKLSTIRKCHTALAEQWGESHPFCRQELRISGKDILIIGLDEKGKDQVCDVLTKQKLFPKIIAPFLKKLVYKDDIAQLWKIEKGVEINPAFSWGQPVASESKIPTHILSSSFHANGKQADAVAQWFGVTKDDVLASVSFERKFAA